MSTDSKVWRNLINKFQSWGNDHCFHQWFEFNWHQRLTYLWLDVWTMSFIFNIKVSHQRKKNQDHLQKNLPDVRHTKVFRQYFIWSLPPYKRCKPAKGHIWSSPTSSRRNCGIWWTMQKSQPLFGTAKVRVSKFIRSSWRSRSCLPTRILWPAATTLEASPSQVSFASFMHMDSRRQNIARDIRHKSIIISIPTLTKTSPSFFHLCAAAHLNTGELFHFYLKLCLRSGMKR